MPHKRGPGRPVTTGPTPTRSMRLSNGDQAEKLARSRGETLTSLVERLIDQELQRTVTLIIYIGLPGCGKTRDAEQWARKDPGSRVTLGRDKLRRLLHGAYLNIPEQEDLVSRAQYALLHLYLRGGVSVAVDDTNLRPEHRKPLEAIAAACGARLEVRDMRDVDPQLCRARNKARTGDDRVPDEAFDAMLDLLDQ